MMDDKTYCVYKHTSPSGKVYIGISCDPIKRWNEGRGYIKNYHFWRAIQKYGWDNITHEILYEELTSDEAKKLEIELIETYKSTDRQYGYNLRDGGDGGFSEESRQKMSKSRMGNQNSKGNHLSEDSKNKISQSLKEYFKTHTHPNLGRAFPQYSGKNHPNSKPVCLIDSDGNILKVYDCVSDAVRDTGCKNISSYCSGKSCPRNGDIWRYYKDGTFVPVEMRHYVCPPDINAPKEVAEIASNGQVIATFKSITAAAKEYDLDLSSVAKCCKGKIKAVKGHVFKYLSDIDQPQADFLIA